MSVEIDQDLCTGCAVCTESCPMDILYMDSEQQFPYSRYPDECWMCGICEMECPVGAIHLRLPPVVTLM